MPAPLRRYVIRELEVSDDLVFVKNGLLGLADISKLIVDDLPEHLYESFTPRFPERVEEFNGDVFAAIRAKHFIVHHPYESFEVFLRYLRQAVRDPPSPVVAADLEGRISETLHQPDDVFRHLPLRIGHVVGRRLRLIGPAVAR